MTAGQGTCNMLLFSELPSTSVQTSLAKDFSKDNREIKIRIYHPGPRCKLFFALSSMSCSNCTNKS